MRVYTEEQLSNKTRDELVDTLNLVQVSDELSMEEKDINIKILKAKLYGNTEHSHILRDIEEGKADPIKQD